MKARVALLVLAAVAGLSGGGLGLASPAAAQVTPGPGNLTPGTLIHGGVVTGVSSNGGSATFDNTAPNVTTINLTASRTIIEVGISAMPGFHLQAGHTLNFVFQDARDTVLLRAANGSATVNGTLNSTVGSTAGSRGGTVWISDASGVTFEKDTVTSVGGLLATTANVPDQDFLLAPSDFSFSGAPADSGVAVRAGAEIRGTGGPVSFIAPTVTTAHGDSPGDPTTIGGPAFGFGDTEVLYGSAQAYTLSFNSDANGLDLRRLFLPQHNPLLPNRGGSINLATPTTADDVYVASAAKAPGGSGQIRIGHTLTAMGAAASNNGDVVLAAGGGLERQPTSTSPMQPVRQQGATAHDLTVTGDTPSAGGLQATGGGAVRALATGMLTVERPVSSTFQNVRLVAGGDLTVASPARLGGSSVALSAGARFLNERGADMIDSSNWTVHSAEPAPNQFNGLNSGRSALWGVAGLPPGNPSGKRYLFSTSPNLTFTSRDLTKVFGQDATGDLTAAGGLGIRYDVAGYHPGVSGAFAGDTAVTAFGGEPALTSPGASMTASVLRGPYPINLAQGTLSNLAGYTFAFNPAGRLTRTPAEFVVPTVTLFQPLGVGQGGWYKTSAKAQVIAGDNSEVDSLDCTVDGRPATIEDAASGPKAQSGAVTVTGNGEHVISCRATDGSGNEKVTSGPLKVDAAEPRVSATCPGTAVQGTSADATIAASDGESGLASDPSGTRAIDTGAPGPQTVTATATDNVGFTTTRSCTTTVVAAVQNPGDTIAPGLTGLKLSPSAFKAAAKGGSIAATGAKLTFSLSEAATVAFSVERKAAGRKSGGKCVAPRPSNRKAKPCTRYVRVAGSFSVSGNGGANSARFTGRVGGEKLGRGNYRLAAVAQDAAGNASAVRRHPFRIR